MKQILIVDDNKAFAHFLGSTLKTHGYDVHHFTDCDESLDFLREGNDDPHYGLLDLYMPGYYTESTFDRTSGEQL